MIVDLFGRLNTSVPEPIPDIVERVPVFVVLHPASDAVPKGVCSLIFELSFAAVRPLNTDFASISSSGVT